MGKIDGVLLDLGVSSPQLDDAERGFSFMRDGPLDMRMDPSTGLSAAEWLMKAEADDIALVLKTFGEERFAKRIARAIVERNRVEPMTRTKELADLIADASPFRESTSIRRRAASGRFVFISTASWKRSSVRSTARWKCWPTGRLSIISFHSLEDRIVKRFMRHHSRGAGAGGHSVDRRATAQHGRANAESAGQNDAIGSGSGGQPACAQLGAAYC